jgi:hypothetical protein
MRLQRRSVPVASLCRIADRLPLHKGALRATTVEAFILYVMGVQCALHVSVAPVRE